MSDQFPPFFSCSPTEYRLLVAEVARLRERRGRRPTDVNGLLQQMSDLTDVVLSLRRQIAELEAARDVWTDSQQTVVVVTQPATATSARAATREVWRAAQKRFPGGNGQFYGAIREATKRGHEWGIDPHSYRTLTSQPCAVCGGPVGLGIGLDRLDNSLGYTWRNVRPCCGPCNVKRGRQPIDSKPAWL